MQLRIDTQKRRDMLRTALHFLIDSPVEYTSDEAKRLYGEMVAEARIVLREIASEEQKSMVQQGGATNPVMAGTDRTTGGAIGQP